MLFREKDLDLGAIFYDGKEHIYLAEEYGGGGVINLIKIQMKI